MLATYAAAALISAASVLTGQAILRACGQRDWAGYAGGVGLAALMAVLSLACDRPGHGTTAAIVLWVALAAALLWLRASLRRPPRDLVLAALAVLVLIALPYLANARFGILGVGLNNDTAAHLPWTQWIQTGGAIGKRPGTGYPTGPHALVAATSRGLGIGVDAGLMGLMMAVPLLTLLAAHSVLDRLPRGRRALGAALVAVCYLAVSYYAQTAFKETIQPLLLLTFVALLRAAARGTPSARSLIPAAVIVAGSFYTYNYLGLAWFVAAIAVWVAMTLVLQARSLRPAEIMPVLRAQLPDARRLALAGLVVLGALALLVLPELSRIPELFKQVGGSPSGTGVIATNNKGPLVGPVPSFEGFGLWPRADFRYAPAPDIKHLLGPLGLLVALWGGIRCIRRGELLLVATAVSAAAIYLVTRHRESVYVAAKGLAVLGPLIMAVSVQGLLTPYMQRIGARLGTVAAVCFVALAGYSSYIVLAGAQVGARASVDQLASFRPQLKDGPSLTLTLDDFMDWELAGTDNTTVNFFAPRPEKRFGEGKATDFDLVPTAVLNSKRYVISTRTSFASAAPGQFRPVRRTRLYTLWKRSGTVPARLTLAEGQNPGAPLDCSTAAGRRTAHMRGWAVVRPKPLFRAVRGKARFILDGEQATFGARLPAGRWDLSLQYVSSQDITVSGLGISARLPAQMDRPSGVYSFARLRTTRAGGIPFRISVDDPYPLPTTTHGAQVLGIAAVPAGVKPRVVPLRSACGRYVDWYTLGPRRPSL